jgi:hypothetical protein
MIMPEYKKRIKGLDGDGQYYMSDESGGPSLYNVKIENGEYIVNPAHTNVWVSPICMLSGVKWKKIVKQFLKGK